jgi:2-iminobutanoate/2-iminopropanoate deaminase
LKPVGESFKAQAEQCFRNLKAIIESSGVTMEHVIKFNVHVSDIKYFAELNEIYQQWVKPPYPARTTVVSGLGIYLIEIDCIAFTRTVRGE